MLDYLLRRDSKTPSSSDSSDAGSKPEQLLPDESAKQAAMLEADGLAGDEAGAVAFILHCGFADARLRAAEHVHSRSSLEQVLQPMRKLDRRVAKLMQTRIDAILKQELIAKHAQDCIVDAQRLLQEMPLVPNRVADMDRNWRSIGEVGDQQRAAYDLLRQEIEARLAAQTALQRSVIDALEGLRKLNATADTMAPLQLAETLLQLDQQAEQYRNAPELPSLPRNLLTEFELEYQRLKDKQTTHEQHSEAAGARSEVLAPPGKTKRDSAPPVKAGLPSGFSDALEAMERALQEGLLHLAAEQDVILRSMDIQSQRASNSQATRLSNARAELKRLQGWAKWGGNVSREELIKAVEDLLAQKMSLDDLAKAVGSSRERWKTLDVASGVAPKALWERFDAACTAAYAPVAEQSRTQAQERQQNRDKARTLITELRQFVEAAGLEKQEADEPAPDWKKIANFQRSTFQAWQRIGHMDRKDRKRAEAEFDGLMQTLLAPLRRQWQLEIERREHMIREVEQININDRKAIDRVRLLQDRWQEIAKSMPLERKDDQALWQRFRSACNAVFAQRKESAAAADAQRRQHAATKENLCAALEAALGESESAIRNLLRETETAWTRVGPVPRAREQQIDGRYRKAVAALRARLDAAKIAGLKAQGTALFEKFSLCRAVESAVLANHPLDPAWGAHWLTLPPLQGARESVMRSRFDAAINALLAGGGDYAAKLQKNSATLQQELLRLEILAGLNSPAELSRQRMQMQVEVLQSSLSGHKEESLGARIDKLCGLAALMDEPSVERIHALLKRV